MKTCFILRGLPGSGKTTLAKWLAYDSEDPTPDDSKKMFSADDYFYDKEGNYNFDVKKIDDAHDDCYSRFVDAVLAGTSCLVVHNTAYAEWEFEEYQYFAKDNGYTVFVLIVENRHGNKSVHDVPAQAYERRERTLRSNIKLR